jgi:hypothetical protein
MSLGFYSSKSTIFCASGARQKFNDLQLAITMQYIVDQIVAVIQPTNPTFKGTSGWAQKFMQRNNIVTRDMTSIIQAALEYKMTAFLQTVREARVG